MLLWDFGQTLVDERWMRRSPIGCATWESSWADVMADLADDGTSVFANGGHAVGAFQGLDCPHSQGGERMICVMPDV